MKNLSKSAVVKSALDKQDVGCPEAASVVDTIHHLRTSFDLAIKSFNCSIMYQFVERSSGRRAMELNTKIRARKGLSYVLISKK